MHSRYLLLSGFYKYVFSNCLPSIEHQIAIPLNNDAVILSTVNISTGVPALFVLFFDKSYFTAHLDQVTLSWLVFESVWLSGLLRRSVDFELDIGLFQLLALSKGHFLIHICCIPGGAMHFLVGADK